MSHVKWSEFDHLLGTKFDVDLANIADCHFTTIQKRRFKLGIKRFDSVSDFWLNIDPFLESHTVSEISKESGIPKARIYQRKRHLGLGSCEESIDWESIDKVLGTKSDSDIAKEFSCSKSSISKRRKKMNMTRSEIDERWKDIDPYIGKQSDYSIAMRFGLYASSVNHRRKTLGIDRFNEVEK